MLSISDGSIYKHSDQDAMWDFSPLYEEIVLVPLLVYIPGVSSGVYKGITSAIDIMPTVLDAMNESIPEHVEGMSLLPRVHDKTIKGRDFTVSTVPFANPGDPVDSVDNIRRRLGKAPVTTVTTEDWSLLYSIDEGMSQLYHLPSDPHQNNDVVSLQPDNARDVHERLIKFMKDTNLPKSLLIPRNTLRI